MFFLFIPQQTPYVVIYCNKVTTSAFLNFKEICTLILCIPYLNPLFFAVWHCDKLLWWQKKRKRKMNHWPTSPILRRHRLFLRLWSQQPDCFLSSGGLPWRLRSPTQRAVTSAALVSLPFPFQPFLLSLLTASPSYSSVCTQKHFLTSLTLQLFYPVNPYELIFFKFIYVLSFNFFDCRL